MKMAFSIIGAAALADGLKIEVIRKGNGDIAESGHPATNTPETPRGDKTGVPKAGV